MPRIEQDVQVIQEDSLHSEQELTHPAFGLVSVSEIHGRNAVFGSDITHDRVLRIRVTQAIQHRHLSNDWNHSKGTIVEFDMTHAQFAQFIASNSGRTTPVTLRTHREGHLYDVPEIKIDTRPLKVEQFRQEIKNSIQKATSRTAQALAKLENAVMDASMSKKQRDSLMALISESRAVTERLPESLNFINQQANEALEGQVNEVKVSLEAYAMRRLSEYQDADTQAPIVLNLQPAD